MFSIKINNYLNEYQYKQDFFFVKFHNNQINLQIRTLKTLLLHEKLK